MAIKHDDDIDLNTNDVKNIGLIGNDLLAFQLATVSQIDLVRRDSRTTTVPSSYYEKVDAGAITLTPAKSANALGNVKDFYTFVECPSGQKTEWLVQFDLPFELDGDADLELSVWYVQDVGGGAFGTSRLGVDVRYSTNLGQWTAVGNEFNVEVDSVSVFGPPERLVRADFGVIIPAASLFGNVVLHGSVYRDALAASDNYAGNVRIVALSWRYLVDKT